MQPPHDPKRPREDPCAWEVQLKYIACRHRFEAKFDACLLEWVAHATPYCENRAQETGLLPADTDRYKQVCITNRLTANDCKTAMLALKQEDTKQKCLGQVVAGGHYWDEMPTRNPNSKSGSDFCTKEWLQPCADARDAAIKKCPNR